MVLENATRRYPTYSDLYHSQEPGFPHGDEDTQPRRDCGKRAVRFYVWNHSSTAAFTDRRFKNGLSTHNLNKVGAYRLSGFFWDVWNPDCDIHDRSTHGKDMGLTKSDLRNSTIAKYECPS